MANIIPIHIAAVSADVPLDTDITLAANSDIKVATQKATKAYVDDARSDVTALIPTGTAADVDIDTDTALAANSDAKVATQKATKAHVAAAVVTAAADATTKANQALSDAEDYADGLVPDMLPFAAAVSPKVVTLVDAATIAVNAALGNTFRVSITDDRTLGNPTGLTDGQVLCFEITQGAGAPNLLAWDTAYTFTTSNPEPTLSATGTDIVSFKNIGGVLRCIGTNLDD